MPDIRIKTDFHRSAAIAVLKAASNQALTVTGNQALKDASKHVPEDQGTLKSSGLSNSDVQAKNQSFVMRWDTPYAEYLWHEDVIYGSPTERRYGPGKLSFTKALAREEWAKYAAEVYKDRWRIVYEAAFGKELD